MPGSSFSVYHITMPVHKISWFIHSNMQEYGTMSGMFGLACRAIIQRDLVSAEKFIPMDLIRDW